KHRLCVGKKCPPCFGEHCSAPPSFEQRRTQVVFKQLDAACNRRLRAMELASRTRHAAEPSNRDEGLQVMQVHFFIRKADAERLNYALDGANPASQNGGFSLKTRTEVLSDQRGRPWG